MADAPDSAPRGRRIDNRYSRFVAWVKLALPLAALALLSTLFLFPGEPGREAADSAGRAELQALMQRRLMRAPTYTSVTEGGGALAVTADTATPRESAPDLFDVSALAVELVAADGGRTTLAARSGVIDRRAQEGTFLGRVRVMTAEGYLLRTERLEATLDGARAVAPLPVRIEGPDLTIEAGAMRATTPEGGPPAGRMLFKDGVRLLYDPEEGTPSAPSEDSP